MSGAGPRSTGFHNKPGTEGGDKSGALIWLINI